METRALVSALRRRFDTLIVGWESRRGPRSSFSMMVFGSRTSMAGLGLYAHKMTERAMSDAEDADGDGS